MHLEADLQTGQQVVRRESGGAQERPADQADRQRDLERRGGGEGEQQAHPQIVPLRQGEERHGEEAQGRQAGEEERQPARRSAGDGREIEDPVPARDPQRHRPAALEPSGRRLVLRHARHPPAVRGEDLVAGPQPAPVRRIARADLPDEHALRPCLRLEAEPPAGAAHGFPPLEEKEA